MYDSHSSSYESEAESESTLSSSLDSVESLEENYNYSSDDSISKTNLSIYQDTKIPDKVLLDQLADLFHSAYRRFEQELQVSELSNKRVKVLVDFFKELENFLLDYLPSTSVKHSSI